MNKKELQGQHYNMAAIIARGWGYEEEGKRSRHKSVCQFDTNKLFQYSQTERKNSGQKFFEYMKIKENRDKKIASCLSDNPHLKNGRNTVIDNIFKSYLIRQETEDILHVKNIEEDFLELLDLSANLMNQELLYKEENIKKVKDYISLQYVRTPLFYRFLFDKYFSNQIEIIKQNTYPEGYPILFKGFSLLDNIRLNNFVDFCNEQIILIYKEHREHLEDYHILAYSDHRINNYLGDMSAFNFDFDRFGIDKSQIEMITKYRDNKYFLDNCIYTPTTSNSLVLAVRYDSIISKEDLVEKFGKLIFPIISKGFHNQILFLYSKYIICPPNARESMFGYIKHFLDMNSLEYLHKTREEEISYLNTLEKLLIDMKEYEKIYR